MSLRGQSPAQNLGGSRDVSCAELLPPWGIGNGRHAQEIATVESEHEDRPMSNLQQWVRYPKVVGLVLGVDDASVRFL
jgi:hypothetical protein